MFSVVIPLYNKAQSIERTLRSVLEQSVQDFEVIVVDDGSTDGGAKVVEATLLSLHRREDEITSIPAIRLIRKENGGVCSARNVGIQAAKYDYVALLDGDDYWDKDYLLEQQKLIKDFPEAALYGINFAEIYNGELIRKLPTALPDGYRGIVKDYFNIPGRISDLFCSSSVVIKKAAFDKAGMFDERLKYSEDIDMWYRIIVNYPVVFYDRYMAFYRYEAENRAMNVQWRPLKYFLPYYADKYAAYKSNKTFYRFIQRWCAVNIRRYYFHCKEQREDARIAAQKLDYAVLPNQYKYLFTLPYWLGVMIYKITLVKKWLLRK